jgi:hypothetical protein
MQVISKTFIFSRSEGETLKILLLYLREVCLITHIQLAQDRIRLRDLALPNVESITALNFFTIELLTDST